MDFTQLIPTPSNQTAPTSKKRAAADIMLPGEIAGRFKSKADFREYLSVK